MRVGHIGEYSGADRDMQLLSVFIPSPRSVLEVAADAPSFADS